MPPSNPLAVGLEQGVVAVLGSKSAAALLRFSRPQDLLLTNCALLAVMHAMMQGKNQNRVSRILMQVAYTIALNTALQWASANTDAALVVAQLMAVFFWVQALQQDGDMALTTQYLLVARLSEALHHREYLPIAWALAFGPTRGFPDDLVQVAQLASVETLSAFLTDWLPRDLLLLSTASLLYLCAPFAEEFPALNRLFRFAVFAIANDTRFTGVPPWLLAAGLWALWQAEEPCSTAKRLASVAGCNMAVLAALDALRFAMDDDPAPTLVALLVVIRIVAEGGQH